MSVRLHYLEVFDSSSVMDLIILMIGLKASVISEKDLIGHSGWPSMKTRDILQRG
jgi:hypothetical protein